MCFVMKRQPPKSQRTDTPLPDTTVFRSPVRAVERRPREALRTQPVLVADDHELVAGIAQPQERRDHAGDEAQLVAGIDLVVGRLLDQGAVAVNEEDRRHVVVPSDCRSEEHTSELQSLMRLSYAVFCLQKKNKQTK